MNERDSKFIGLPSEPGKDLFFLWALELQILSSLSCVVSPLMVGRDGPPADYRSNITIDLKKRMCFVFVFLNKINITKFIQTCIHHNDPHLAKILSFFHIKICSFI